jgi:hypothetical protein
MYFRGHLRKWISRAAVLLSLWFPLRPHSTAALSNHSISLCSTFPTWSSDGFSALLGFPGLRGCALGIHKGSNSLLQEPSRLGCFHSSFLRDPTHSASTNLMPAAKILFMPAGLAALVCCLVVTSIFAASGAIGWYYVWGTSSPTVSHESFSNVQSFAAYQHVEPYKSEHARAAIIAGTQGGLCTLIVGESIYG